MHLSVCVAAMCSSRQHAVGGVPDERPYDSTCANGCREAVQLVMLTSHRVVLCKLLLPLLFLLLFCCCCCCAVRLGSWTPSPSICRRCRAKWQYLAGMQVFKNCCHPMHCFRANAHPCAFARQPCQQHLAALSSCCLSCSTCSRHPAFCRTPVPSPLQHPWPCESASDGDELHGGHSTHAAQGEGGTPAQVETRQGSWSRDHKAGHSFSSTVRGIISPHTCALAASNTAQRQHGPCAAGRLPTTPPQHTRETMQYHTQITNCQ